MLTIWFYSFKFSFYVYCLPTSKSNWLYFSGDWVLLLVCSSSISSIVSLFQRRMCFLTTHFPNLESYTPEAQMSGLVTVFAGIEAPHWLIKRGLSEWAYFIEVNQLGSHLLAALFLQKKSAVTLMVAITRNGRRQPWSTDLLLLLEIECLDSFWQIVNEFLFPFFIVYFRLSDSNF